jgi:hypothetical protein
MVSHFPCEVRKNVSIYLFEIVFSNPSPPPFSKGRRNLYVFFREDYTAFQSAKFLERNKLDFAP